MKVITLCGSTAFKEEYVKANAELTLEGNVVFSVGLFGKEINDTGKKHNTLLTTEQKRLLDAIHIVKIDMSDEIYVLNVNGYIGKSTQNEIDYAIKTGKAVTYLENGA